MAKDYPKLWPILSCTPPAHSRSTRARLFSSSRCSTEQSLATALPPPYQQSSRLAERSSLVAHIEPCVQSPAYRALPIESRVRASVFAVGLAQQPMLIGISAPAYTAHNVDTPFGLLDVLCAVGCIAGLATAYVADNQLRAYMSASPRPTPILNTGLWKYSVCVTATRAYRPPVILPQLFRHSSHSSPLPPPAPFPCIAAPPQLFWRAGVM